MSAAMQDSAFLGTLRVAQPAENLYRPRRLFFADSSSAHNFQNLSTFRKVPNKAKLEVLA
ncbi:hypothetical protein BH10PLA2_BH10PLA2_18800 [soil metagenome]